ncbi:MAG TPA: flagellar biosynthesis anti-sigma factor FlgM [Chthonomonadaceae bacterium]|nr:flagellar biosynthesis anti-sigma factor FlgM [Chthonomonadaceae bacterium]
MKISVEEVNRLIAMAPMERGSNRYGTGSSFQAQAQASEGRPAAVVDISTSAQEIQQVKQVVNQLPDVREERVRALKAQVENGTYHVSGEDIADLIIRRALADNTAL